MTAATHFYRAAARVIAPVLAVQGVRSIYVRRSVAAGDARFPWSDLDLAVVMDEPSGADLLRLWKRWRVARALFPRMGECQVFASDDLEALAATDPYRASLDRRFARVAWGERPVIPERVIDQRAAARRLAFWFQRYLPDVVRRGRLRDQRKIALEMYNALGVLMGLWAEPLATRSETDSRARAARLLLGDALEQPFAACCRVAERACELLALRAPAISDVLRLDGLTIVPGTRPGWPDAAQRSPITVVTPAALQMLLELQDPFLWLRHGGALGELGFAPPSRRAWIEAATRTARPDQLRTPGFMGKKPESILANLALAENVVSRLESGQALGGLSKSQVDSRCRDTQDYYTDAYDGTVQKGREVYRRAQALFGELPAR